MGAAVHYRRRHAVDDGGRRILHIEAPPEEVVMRGGLFHGFQLGVNLPAWLKMTPPRYQDIRGGQR